MDLVSLILGIICCARENMILAIVTLVIGFTETMVLLTRKRDFNISYTCGIFAMIVGVYRICTL